MALTGATVLAAAVTHNPSSSHSIRIDRRWALLAVLLIAVELFAWVGAAWLTPGSSPPQSGASYPSHSAYAKLFAQVGPDGSVSKETALEAFALAIAPLPGVTPPTGDPPSLYERMDGTFAVDWLQPYMDQLTPDQKAAVDAALAPDPSAPVVTPATSSWGIPVALADSPETYFEDFVKAAQPTEAAKLGRSLNLSWTVTLNQMQTDSSLAYTNVVFFPLYGSTGCDIHVNPSLQNSGDEAGIQATMAHELFHCFQDDWFDQHGGHKNLPDWIIEGQAEWAGESAAGPSDVGRDWWGTYLTTMDTPLWQRTYDAVGFYQHLSEEGIDPWQHFDAMLATTSNSDAFKAAGAAADTFLDTWASGLFRDGTLGAPWRAEGPWYLTARSTPHDLAVGNGDSRDLATNAVLNQDWNATSTADLVEIRMTGHVRLHTDPATDETDTAQRWLCTKPGGCACPPGQGFNGPDYDTVAPAFELALTGSLDGASGSVTGHSLDEYCRPMPSQPPASPCKTNCGNSNGDPHMRTVNSFKYDFQGAGEFTLLESLDGSVEIQARQVAVSDTFMGGVAINTAVGAMDNGHRVGVYMQPSGLEVHVDGAVVDATTPIDLGAGAAVHTVTNGVELDFPDGTILWTLSVAPWGINAIVQPSDDLRANGRGLLGSIVRGGLGVPALPDGTRLPAATDAHQRFTEVYGPFADAWRVTDGTSLFDYDPGQSTATFTDRSFPTEQQFQAYSSFSPDTQAAAASACASIGDADLLSDCEFDVAATGNAGYADLYVAQQDFYDNGILPPTPAPTATSSFAPSSPGTGVSGAVKVTDLTGLDGTAIGDGDTLYALIEGASVGATTAPATIVAVDATSAAITAHADVAASTHIAFAAGSLWVTDLPGAVASGCSVTRLDGGALVQQAVVAVPCSPFGSAEVVSDGEALWVTDYSAIDISTDKGVLLRRIDPATNQLAAGIVLPDISGGYFIDSQGALFYWNPDTFLYRLRVGQTSFDNFDNPSFFGNPVTAGQGLWVQDSGGSQARLLTDPGATVEAIPLAGSIVAGDDQGVYEEVLGNDGSEQLWRQPADGTVPFQVASAPTIDGQGVNYFDSSTTKYATADGFVALWTSRPTQQSPGALYLQWVARP